MPHLKRFENFGWCRHLNILVFMALMAHARAVFSDPGIVPFPQSRIDFSDMHSGKFKIIVLFFNIDLYYFIFKSTLALPKIL